MLPGPTLNTSFIFSNNAEEGQTAQLGGEQRNGEDQAAMEHLLEHRKAGWERGAAQRAGQAAASWFASPSHTLAKFMGAAAGLRCWKGHSKVGDAVPGSLITRRTWKKVGVEVVVFPQKAFFYFFRQACG